MGFFVEKLNPMMATQPIFNRLFLHLWSLKLSLTFAILCALAVWVPTKHLRKVGKFFNGLRSKAMWNSMFVKKRNFKNVWDLRKNIVTALLIGRIEIHSHKRDLILFMVNCFSRTVAVTFWWSVITLLNGKMQFPSQFKPQPYQVQLSWNAGCVVSAAHIVFLPTVVQSLNLKCLLIF